MPYVSRDFQTEFSHVRRRGPGQGYTTGLPGYAADVNALADVTTSISRSYAKLARSCARECAASSVVVRRDADGMRADATGF
jgi:hypothetical protein